MTRVEFVGNGSTCVALATDELVFEKKCEPYKVSPAELLDVPLALGSVVPMYNLPGLD